MVVGSEIISAQRVRRVARARKVRRLCADSVRVTVARVDIAAGAGQRHVERSRGRQRGRSLSVTARTHDSQIHG